MKILKYFGDAFVLSLIVLGFMASCSPAKASRAPAPVTYELVLVVYSTADGHSVAMSSYLDVIRVPGFQTLTACDTAGEAAIEHFRSTPRTYNLSRDLLDFVCLKVPG